MLLLKPDVDQFERALLHVVRGLSCGRPSAAPSGTSGGDTIAATSATSGPSNGQNTSASSSASTLGASDLSAVLRRVQLETLHVSQIEASLLFRIRTRAEEEQHRQSSSFEPGGANQTEWSNSSLAGASSGSGSGMSMAAELTPAMRRALLDRPCFREEQTGLACYFTATHRLRVLPCPYSWDVGNELHLKGQQHYRGCLRKSHAGAETCDAIAHHVAERCVWPRAASDVHVIHWKGKNKPWKHIERACDGAMHGRLSTADDETMRAGGVDTSVDTSVHTSVGASGASATPSAKARRPLVAGVDRLLFGGNKCRLRTPFEELGVGPEVFWADGAPINETCCDDITLLRAEWWHMARSVRSWSVVRAVLPGVVADQLIFSRFMSSNATRRPANVTCVDHSRLCDPAKGVQALTAVGGTVCVSSGCGFVGPGPLRPRAMKGCSARQGGRDQCCAGFIQRFGEPCCRPRDIGCVVTAPPEGRGTH